MTNDDLLSPFDLDLGLKEIRDNPDEHWTLRALCGATVGVDPATAAVEAETLHLAVLGSVENDPAAKQALADILGHGSDYQRCLWFTIAGRGPFAVYDLGQLVELCRARLSLVTQVDPAKLVSAYECNKSDGPRGSYSVALKLKNMEIA